MSKVQSMIKACSELVTHFKRCEINSTLPISLKQECDTRWNSICDMLNSIYVNFKRIEEVLLSRKEHVYMDSIDEQLLKDVSVNRWRFMTLTLSLFSITLLLVFSLPL